ncbi:MAG: fibronectin type III domain-containing protein, partial [Eubacterium sp.]|nr:fibronectin type III domain-containing protein [Eubacterium sp.]
IASRIVKEVGATNPTATGVCGTKKPFNGIYNYYSIGASNGATSGLEWASGFLRTESKATLYAEYDSAKKAGKGKETAVAAKQYMSYISTHGNYYKVRLYSQSSYAVGLTGYILRSKLRTTYFNYQRPWTNPYRSIVGGAEYIAEKYLEYQNTGYLEKFNVNSSSGSLYSHEYMQNVDAVSIESVSTYKAYKNAGILDSKIVFYIPVFENMPNGASSPEPVSPVPSALSLTSRTTETMSFKWNEAASADKFYLNVENLTKKTSFGKTVTGKTASIKNLTPGNKYRIKVRAYVGGEWSDYSAAVTYKAIPMRCKLTSVSSPERGKIYSSWGKIKGASGYQLRYARDKKFKKTVAAKKFASGVTEYTGKNFTKGVTYYIKVRAYTTVNGKKYYGKWSKIKSVKSK